MSRKHGEGGMQIVLNSGHFSPLGVKYCKSCPGNPFCPWNWIDGKKLWCKDCSNDYWDPRWCNEPIPNSIIYIFAGRGRGRGSQTPIRSQTPAAPTYAELQPVQSKGVSATQVIEQHRTQQPSQPQTSSTRNPPQPTPSTSAQNPQQVWSLTQYYSACFLLNYHWSALRANQCSPHTNFLVLVIGMAFFEPTPCKSRTHNFNWYVGFGTTAIHIIRFIMQEGAEVPGHCHKPCNANLDCVFVKTLYLQWSLIGIELV